jgi:cobalamin biosynthesis protein CobT
MSSLLSSYERLARIYAEQENIPIIISGTGFATDGKKIIVPDIPDEKLQELGDPTVGGILHECMHIKYSDISESMTPPDLEKFRVLLNDIEDCRMLFIGKKYYPGQDLLQHKTLEFISKNILSPEMENGELHESEYLGIAILYMYSNAEHLLPEAFPKEIIEMAECTKDIWNNVNWEIKKDKQGKGQNIKIVRKIIEKLKMVAFPEEELKPSKKKNLKKQKISIKNLEKETEENSEKETEENSEKETEENSEKETEENEKQKIAQKILAGREKPNNTDLFKQLKKIIEIKLKFYAKTTNRHVPHPKAILLDREKEITDLFKTVNPLSVVNPERQIDTNLNKFKRIADKSEKQIETLKAKIFPLLMAEKRCAFLPEQEEGLLDGGNLFRAFNQDSKIYKKRVNATKINTAISILCDISGSMRGSKIELLRPTVLILGDTLFKLKIPFEILSFTTNEAISRADVDKDKEEYNRFEGLEHTIYKSFNSNYTNSRFSIVELQASEDNVDGESVLWAAKRLIQRKEVRKILFVLSDGSPAAYFSNHKIQNEYLKEIISKIEKSGIEVIGIGLCSSDVSQFYKNHVVIHKEQDISEFIYMALVKSISRNIWNIVRGK